MASHETLKVWQHARRLAAIIRRIIKTFPSEEHCLVVPLTIRDELITTRDETARTLFGLLRSINQRIQNGEKMRIYRPGAVRKD